VPGRKIIENSDRVAFVQQCMYQMRAHEPSAAGHEKTSHPKTLQQLQIPRLEMFSSTGALLHVLSAFWGGAQM
jgi:hypothetical protein